MFYFQKMMFCNANCDALSKFLHTIIQGDGYQESKLFCLVLVFRSHVNKMLKIENNR